MKQLHFICEVWRPCPDYENNYEVSNFGNVRNKKTLRLLKLYLNNKKYLEVRLFKSGKETSKIIHRLVGKAFLSNLNGLPQINHKDGIKHNNNVNNLEWSTNSENQLHAYRIGLQRSRKGEGNNNTCLTEIVVEKIKAQYNSGERLKELSQKHNINLSILRNIIYGRTWTHNLSKLIKRDDRKNKLKEDINKSIITKFSRGLSGTSVVQLTKNNTEVCKFRSINDAAKQTGIPRKSIEAVVNNKKFHSSKNHKSWTMKEAGGFFWKKTNINQIQDYL